MTLNAEAEGYTAAARFRREHHLGVQPLGDLVAVIEQATGIDVAVLDVGPDEHGLSMRDPARDTVFIGVARTRNPMRQRSTLAYELGHVLFEDWADGGADTWNDRSPAEIRADAFARHLLVTSTAHCRPTPISGGHRNGCSPARSGATRRGYCLRRPSAPCAASHWRPPRRTCARQVSCPSSSRSRGLTPLASRYGGKQ
ncbi:MAG: ImmA/IrrE family metallo-endopeptidase [Pseudonocardiales bacterium]